MAAARSRLQARRSAVSHTARRRSALSVDVFGDERLNEQNDSSKGRPGPMTPLGTSKHLAARMGRWSASHWKTATFGWLAFVAAAFVIGNLVGTNTIDVAKS